MDDPIYVKLSVKEAEALVLACESYCRVQFTPSAVKRVRAARATLNRALRKARKV